MKKSILFAAAALLLSSGTVSAALEQSPVYYSENFTEMLDGDRLKDGWFSRGIDADPVGQYPQMFFGTLLDDSNPEKPVYGAPYYTNVLLSYAGEAFPLVNTNYGNSATPDQWIISPEIEIKKDLAVLKCDVIGYSLQAMGFGQLPYEIMISEGGTESSDFTALTSKVLSNTGSTEIARQTLLLPIKNYGDKKVRIAFHTTAKNMGFIGFSNIEIGDYAFSYTNTTQTVAKQGDKVPVSVNIGMKTAMSTSGVTAVLEYGDKKIVKTFKKQFGSSSTNWVFQMLRFNGADEMIVMESNKSIPYKVTITPNYLETSGVETPVAEPVIVTGTLIVVEKEYPNNVVVEEHTATGCGWCPRGMGAMSYYKDLLPGNEGEGKFIGINIHGYMNHYDPMNQGVQEYVSNFITAAMTGGLPMANFNRKITGKDPSSVASFNSCKDETSIYKGEIIGGAFPETTKIGDEISFKVSLKAGFTGQPVGNGINVALVLVENDVKGNEDNYTQSNYLYNLSSPSTAGAAGVPVKYLEKFLAGGEFGQEYIRFDKIAYQEVARGIYPNYYGRPFKENQSFVLDVPQETTISLTIPETVVNVGDNDELDMSKFEVVALFIDTDSGAIVASDSMGFTTAASVESVAGDASAISVARDGKVLNVAAPASVKVALYGIDGVCLGTYDAADGVVAIDGSALNGVVIVRAEAAGENKVIKTVF